MRIDQSMILELDVGNSRIKWRLITMGESELRAEGHVSGFEELNLLPELDVAIEMARMCSVRGGDTNKKIEEWIRRDYGIELARAEVTRSCGGVSNQYADVSRLGIDRWLAMLAGYNRADGACMVIDSGTAFTIDVVDAEGLHQGGYILPGLALMQGSLETNTAIRLSNNYTAYSKKLGHSTDEAVFNGTVTALLAVIRQQSELLCKEGVRTFFAGGDAELLHSLAMLEHSEIATSLVFEGLDIACPCPKIKRERV